jgi:hypothetical protein
MFLISSSVVLFVPYLSFEAGSKNKTAAYALGGAFWLFLIGGIAFQIILTRLRKKNSTSPRARPVLLRFCSNKAAIVFDLLLVLSLIGNIVFLFLISDLEWLQISVIFGLILGIEMHFVFNSENYKYINKNMGGQKNEQN